MFYLASYKVQGGCLPPFCPNNNCLSGFIAFVPHHNTGLYRFCAYLCHFNYFTIAAVALGVK
ncbi:hypothetical protein C7N43_18660 [Sphingobacteriales bacterium UPWRP_1]|nr:hypothetical protein B6N25_06505 [Sphingobacteriales bacterium TSM_CSS]PSJ75474.1 hypothetical protein C7N43_18660 [Sphingobacteriales bacterium UPWRP_1]